MQIFKHLFPVAVIKMSSVRLGLTASEAHLPPWYITTLLCLVVGDGFFFPALFNENNLIQGRPLCPMPHDLLVHKLCLLNSLNLSKTTFLLNLLQVYLIKLTWLGLLAASATTRRYCQLPLSEGISSGRTGASYLSVPLLRNLN